MDEGGVAGVNVALVVLLHHLPRCLMMEEEMPVETGVVAALMWKLWVLKAPTCSSG